MSLLPYRNDHIITVICALYFDGDKSFVECFHEHLPLSHNNDGSMSYEVLMPMVALVATTVSHPFVGLHKQCTNSIQLYVALFEWHSGTQQVAEFSVTTFTDIYHSNLGTLEFIQTNQQGAFHAMMANIYSWARWVCCFVTLLSWCICLAACWQSVIPQGSRLPTLTLIASMVEHLGPQFQQLRPSSVSSWPTVSDTYCA